MSLRLMVVCRSLLSEAEFPLSTCGGGAHLQRQGTGARRLELGLTGICAFIQNPLALLPVLLVSKLEDCFVSQATALA